MSIFNENLLQINKIFKSVGYEPNATVLKKQLFPSLLFGPLIL